jgi:tetratricopeptide (TPR) repeat protein
MKAEERKELQTNTLAQTLSHTLEGLREGPSRSTVLFLVVVALVLVLIFTWRYFSQAARETDSGRWMQWDDIATEAQLKTYLDTHELEATIQGRLARFLEARQALAEGLQNIGQKGIFKQDAVDKLKIAADKYSKLADECADRPLLQQEALLNAGRAEESLARYNDALAHYKQLEAKYPDTARGKTAKKRIAQLTDPANEKDREDLRKDFGPETGLPPAIGPLPPSPTPP